MNSFSNFMYTSVLVTAIISWFVAQILKVIGVLIKEKHIDFKRLIGSGGMPSSHSSFVTALTTAVLIKDGLCSTTFAISCVMSLVVMYDAAGVRYAAGQQAKILNKLIDEWESSTPLDKEKKLKELLGHTPKEVFAGAVLGIAIGIIRHI